MSDAELAEVLKCYASKTHHPFLQWIHLLRFALAGMSAAEMAPVKATSQADHGAFGLVGGETAAKSNSLQPKAYSDWQRVVGERGLVLRIVEGGDRASRFLQPIDPPRVSTSSSSGLSSCIWGSRDKEPLLRKRFRDRSWQA
jgi:hypothetical protein